MDLNLTGKNALVCGASSGIGEAVAIELAQLGAKVTLLSRSQDKLSNVQKKLHNPDYHQIAVVDLSDRCSIVDTLTPLIKKQNIHILINNAGGPKAGPLFEAGVEEFEIAFRTHILASQTLTQLLVPGMKQEKYGRIINIISTSVKAPIPNLGVSNTIRGAMANWSKTMANELGAFNITVNNVLPGFTQTERLEKLKDAASQRLGKTKDEVEKMWKDCIPMGRLAESFEVANAVCFLASPAASYINGINVPVDGGRTPTL